MEMMKKLFTIITVSYNMYMRGDGTSAKAEQ